jgi:hypothetical protein
MNPKARAILIAATTVATGIAGSSAWAAGGDSWANSYSANTAPFVSSCPPVQWHFVHTSPTDITGTAFYNDLSGVSTFKGKLDSSGKLHGTLTSIHGQGPEGTVDGAKHGDGSMDLEVNGGNCSKGLVHVTMSAQAGGGGGGKQQ